MAENQISKTHKPFVAGAINLNTDKYYRGSQRSVIDNDHVTARRGRPGAAFPQPPTMKFNDRDLNSGKYYESNYGQPKVEQAVAARQASQRAAAPRVAPGEVIRLDKPANLQLTVARIVAGLNTGEALVSVLTSPELFQPLGMQLDLAVARAQITPERRRDVRIGEIPAAAIRVGKAIAADVLKDLPSVQPDEIPFAPAVEEPELSDAEMRAIVGGAAAEASPETAPAEIPPVAAEVAADDVAIDSD